MGLKLEIPRSELLLHWRFVREGEVIEADDMFIAQPVASFDPDHVSGNYIMGVIE